ncbi:uncharacterized protein MELLADRAFT_91976 [Melampsora larici-populina 98AG31]|uniref:C2H2-type domain-containing protein n=1 Tax=Melampsora larici-populina (strain 98AG31 / pathotype 3-4-7) TaxID=747676 RepID=F4S133_MELLP|nr:uncharacterized protein MELLADRAFT_91976 [Melampsora larici-populina 98AG31]EGG01709.1 hypothetical protein MELLADRAFT_91976 [Melampsora larici-populina 98AG31]
MMSPTSLDLYDGTSEVKPSIFHGGFANNIPCPPDDYSLLSPPVLSGKDQFSCFQFDSHHDAALYGAVQVPLFKRPFDSSHLGASTRLDLAEQFLPNDHAWPQHPLDPRELVGHSLEALYETHWLEHDRRSDTSPPSSVGSIFEIPSSPPINIATPETFLEAPQYISSPMVLDESSLSSAFPCMINQPPRQILPGEESVWDPEYGCPSQPHQPYLPLSSGAPVTPSLHFIPEAIDFNYLPYVSPSDCPTTLASPYSIPRKNLAKPPRPKTSARSRKRPHSDTNAQTSPSLTINPNTQGYQLLDYPITKKRKIPKVRPAKFVCDFIPSGKSTSCGQSFDRTEHLKRHLVAHYGEKRFSCSICGRKFGRNEPDIFFSNLNQHIKTHDNYNGRNSRLLRARMLQEQSHQAVQDGRRTVTM